MRDLAGRTAVLTGASGGLGSYIARALAREQVNLVLVARSAAGLASTAEKLRSCGVTAISVPTDITDQAGLETLVAKAESEFGAIDVLVNNAGLVRPLPYHKRPAENIEQVMRVNLTAPMLLTRMVLPGMLERRFGYIVNMSSLAGKAGPPCEEAYAASKAGLIGFTKSLRLEYRGTGVGASVVCSGFVGQGGMFERLRDGTGLAAPWLLGSVRPEAVARAVVRAIKKGIPEIIVSAIPVRLFTTLAELSPSLGEWMIRWSGAADLFRKAAERMEARVGGSENDP